MHTNFTVIVNSRPSVAITTRTHSNTRTITLTRALRPSIILVSIHVPNVSNVRTAQRVDTLRRHFTTSKARSRIARAGIVVLAAFSLSRCIVTTVATKTSNFLLGSARPRALLGSVHAIFRNGTVVTPSTAGHLVRGVVRNSFVTAGINEPRGSTAASTASSACASPRLSRLASHRHRILVRVTRKLSGRRVTSGLFVDLPAIGARITRVLSGVGTHSHIRTIIFTCRGRLI